MKKTTMRRLTAAVAAICMCAMTAMPMMAGADSLTITDSTNVSVAGKEFTAYKLFTLTKNGTSYAYTINSEWKEFFVDCMATANATAAEGNTKTDLVAKYKAMNDETFSTTVAAYMSTLGSDNSAKIQELSEALKAEVTNKAFNANGYSYAAKQTAAAGATSVELNFATQTDAGTGYYLVLETSAIGDNNVKSAVILNTVETKTIALKADKPAIEKKIWEPTTGGEAADTTIDEDELVDANNAYIGETVHYVIDSTVPDTTFYEAYTYKITDTLSKGLTVTKNTEGDDAYAAFKQSIKITMGEDVLTYSDTYAEDADYNVIVTPNADESITIEVVFWDFLDTVADHSAAGEEIRMTYDAIVDTDAVIGITGNPNKVDLTYSNDPSNSSDGWYDDGDDSTDDTDDPDHPDYDDDDTPETPVTPPTTSTTPEDIVITYLTEMELVKVDDSTPANSLAGAVFSIESTTGQTKYYVSVARNADDTADIATVTEVTADSETSKYEVEVASTGKLVLTGLAAGTYTITEEVPPANYNKLTTPINIVIECTVPETVDTVSDTCEWTFTRYNGAVAEANKIETTTFKAGSDGKYSFEVVNRKGTLFPATGGIGTTVFTVTGISLMLGAAGLYIVKRRVSSK